MSSHPLPNTLSEKSYLITDITIILCVRLTDKNPWITDRLSLYTNWFKKTPNILIVDYGSEKIFAKTLRDLSHQNNYHYHYVDNKGGFSLSDARNIGFIESGTDLVFFTDPDFIFERDIFQRLLKLANALDFRCNTLKRITMPAYHISKSYTKLFEAKESSHHEKEKQLLTWMHYGVYSEYNRIFEYISPYSNNFLCHRDFYDLVGGYSTDFIGHGSEDFEFIIRANLLHNTMPIPRKIELDLYKPGELETSSSEYIGFRRLAEVEAFTGELQGFRSFHLWHPRIASEGWYEKNDMKRKMFNTVVARYINNPVDLLKEDFLPRNKKALCVITDKSHLKYFLLQRMNSYSFDVLSRSSQIKKILDKIRKKKYQQIFCYDSNLDNAIKIFLDEAKNYVEIVFIKNSKLSQQKITSLNEDYQYSSNSYAARKLNLNNKKDLKEYVQTKRRKLSLWQGTASRIFSFIMTPFLSPLNKSQLKSNPQQFFSTAKHPFSVWIGKKLNLRS